MFGGKTLKEILEAPKQSLANNVPIENIDDIIVHVFSIDFYKTGNHNRHNVLEKSCIMFLDHVLIPNNKLYCLFWQYTLDIFRAQA
jgi:hypothetical protein